MTDYKERVRGRGHRSLYLGLLYNIVIGFVLAILVFCMIYIPAWYVISHHYTSAEMQMARRSEYLSSLQKYVVNHNITKDTWDEIAGWVGDNPYVFLLVYKSGQNTEAASHSFVDVLRPGEKDRLGYFPGSRIGESLDLEELTAAAQNNGFTNISLNNGTIIVAISEYTENLYYGIFIITSVLASLMTFVLALVRYIRVLIERIKRFEGDVTIVSEFNMDYEIVSEGRDEIAKLSTNVERMRRTMLDHVKNEQEAREANTELITSISHDIRTPLTVLMGYIEMMKDQVGEDDVMRSYIDATENTALRLKNLSDDMFKYSLAFGDTKKSVKLEEYDFIMLNEQLFSEHFLLMRENGYDIRVETCGEEIKEGTTVRTDASNLMRIVDNIFSNLQKYADKAHPILFTMRAEGRAMLLECRNKIRTDTEGAESNGIGLKTCVRLGSLVAKKFEYKTDGEYFVCRLVLDIKPPIENEEEK